MCYGERGGGGGGGGAPLPPPAAYGRNSFNLKLERWAIFTMMSLMMSIASNVHFVFAGLSGTFI